MPSLSLRLSMGEGGGSSVTALVNYDPSITSPKAIAGNKRTWVPGTWMCGDLLVLAAGRIDCPAVWNLEIPARSNSKREVSDQICDLSVKQQNCPAPPLQLLGSCSFQAFTMSQNPTPMIWYLSLKRPLYLFSRLSPSESRANSSLSNFWSIESQ